MAFTPDEPSSIPTYYSWFPGEDFLSVQLPNYERERHQIVRNIIVVVILFIFVLPYFFATKKVVASSIDSGSSATSNVQNQSPGSNDKHHPSKRRIKGRNGKKEKQPQSIQQQSTKNESKDQEEVVEFSAVTSNILTLLCILIIFGVLFFSDNNLFPARTVLLAPIFTKEECKYIIEMAHAAAERNAKNAQKEKEQLLLEHPRFMDLDTTSKEEDEEFSSDDPHLTKLRALDSMLKAPSGWTKDRHNVYPTTDLNVVTDPFTSDDRTWLANRLNSRLAPLVERGMGIFRGSIRANDIFVVRYDATKGQANLRRHTDSSHLSFNILLNDEFEGGGTRFHSRPDKSHFDVHPDVGEALISHAEILHEGLTTTSGTRYILVGFDSIDAKDPLTGEDTNLSLFSSWLNFSWMAIRFKEGHLDGRRTRNLGNERDDEQVGDFKYSRYAVSLFRDLYNAMTILTDTFAPFRRLKTVATEDSESYIEVMDEAMQKQKVNEAKLGIGVPLRSAGYASWFRGQQLDLDVFGNFKTSWKSRADEEDKFRGEEL